MSIIIFTDFFYWLNLGIGIAYAAIFIVLAAMFKRQIRKTVATDIMYGNSYDLGDVRAESPFFNLWATYAWNSRNTAMGFQYLWMNY